LKNNDASSFILHVKKIDVTTTLSLMCV